MTLHQRLSKLFSFVAFNCLFFAFFLSVVYQQQGKPAAADVKKEAAIQNDLRFSSLKAQTNGEQSSGKEIRRLAKLQFN